MSCFINFLAITGAITWIILISLFAIDQYGIWKINQEEDEHK
jgi:hypothetical protein